MRDHYTTQGSIHQSIPEIRLTVRFNLSKPVSFRKVLAPFRGFLLCCTSVVVIDGRGSLIGCTTRHGKEQCLFDRKPAPRIELQERFQKRRERDMQRHFHGKMDRAYHPARERKTDKRGKLPEKMTSCVSYDKIFLGRQLVLSLRRKEHEGSYLLPLIRRR